MAQAALAILADELKTIRQHGPALLRDADVIAVHETRKAIRRSFTAMKLFDRYFEPGVFMRYRKPLRKMMRRLGHCRDAAVFLMILSEFLEGDDSLAEHTDHWRKRKARSDARLRRYLGQPAQQQFLDDYTRFVNTPGPGLQTPSEIITPNKISYLGPILIYERLAAVRAYDGYLEGASIDLLHRLRIKVKELRYTLRFFRPILGPEIDDAMKSLRKLQTLLGDMNDAKVALELMEDLPQLAPTLVRYHAERHALLAELIEGLPPLWAEFNNLEWRRRLANGVAAF